jgi:hypothetical protein
MVDLFAGICVSDYEAARRWYERLFGSEPSFVAHETECVWELGEHRFVFILEDPARAGHATITLFVDDLDALVGASPPAASSLQCERPTRTACARATYRDPDGNEIGYGSPPAR